MSAMVKISPQVRLLLAHLSANPEAFLQEWAKRMGAMGYMAYTTAKREDCTVSLHYLLNPILSLLTSHEQELSFDFLMKQRSWADDLLGAARRHRARGVTLSMFMGCFKTLIQAVENVIECSDLSAEHKNEAMVAVRHAADAFETLLLEESAYMNEQETVKVLDDKNRQLSLEKCKYENILSSISDLVFLIDMQGKIFEANKSALSYLQTKDVDGSYIWEHLPLSSSDLQDLMARCIEKRTRSLIDPVHACYFDVTLVALNGVSLASKAYLLIFTDVSAHVEQKSVLEHLVARRTAALAREKVQLEEMNITLKTVLNSIEREKNATASSQAQTLKEQVFPILRKIRAEPLKESRDIYLESLEKKLIALMAEDSEELEMILPSALTAVEIKVCRMLKDGHTSKSIAQALNVSVETIHTHRKNIRSKLGLQGKKSSLFNILKSTQLI